MESLRFKTNINCVGCVAKVIPFLNNESGIEKWEVDVFSPEKILTVEANNTNAQIIIKKIEKAGFKAEEL